MGTHTGRCRRLAGSLVWLGMIAACDRPAPSEEEPRVEPPPESVVVLPLEETLSVGLDHACALTPQGAAYCWGGNDSGQLGDGTRTSSRTPVAVAGGLVFRQLAARAAQTCGLTGDGSLYCWGLIGAYSGPLTPTRVLPGQRYQHIAQSLDNNRTFVLSWEGDVYRFTGTAAYSLDTVASGRQFSQIALTHWHSVLCGLAGDGIAYCSPPGWKPNAVQGTVRFKEIAGGWDFFCGLTATGKPYCWDQLSAPAPASESLAFEHLSSKGNEWLLGLTSNGDVYTFRRGSAPVLEGRGFARIAQGNSWWCGITLQGAAVCGGTPVPGGMIFQ